MAPSNVKRARFEAKNDLVAEEKKTPLTITDLPTELIDMIFNEMDIPSIKSTDPVPISIRPSTLTCWTIRNVAVNYLTFTHCYINGTDDLDHFLRFLRHCDRARRTVRMLRLDNAVLDATRVNDIKQVFPNLVDIMLKDITCDPPSIHANANGQPGQPAAPPLAPPRRLDQLHIMCTRATSGWSLSGMMHTLSLLRVEPQVLYVSTEHCGYSEDAFDPRCVVGLSAVPNLVVCFHDPESSTPIAGLLDALSHTLDPNVLQSVEVQYDSKETLRALGAMLERVGRNVIKLTIKPHAPSTFQQRQAWVDPFDDWRLLDIRPCQKLVYLSLHIYVRRKKNVSKALSLPGAGLIANYAPPATFRKVVIHLHDLPRATTLGNRSVLKLQEFDKVLTQDRFPHVRQLYLDVGITEDLYDTPDYREECRAAARRALPRLGARGLLEVLVQRWFE
ncbi:hypothetical protein L226DRAFT_612546 [Lentinus tigrinus ALCF2SS1-7]|uniref:uncharacterized protein n=1 Tax=Lentinus tigrinus ALCF2SS1-7 TaxID=1328758 RepID=UPI00116607C5|nr:hypothetical protein L226DRAFT_612546 [Lentinus tigrinus ALCF2SS1-7]